MRKQGSKERIRQFLLTHIGQVVTSIQIRDAAGTSVSEWARRVRELREDEGWPILTHNDTTDLKPGQYLLREAPPDKAGVVFASGMSAKLPSPPINAAFLGGASTGPRHRKDVAEQRLHLSNVRSHAWRRRPRDRTQGPASHRPHHRQEPRRQRGIVESPRLMLDLQSRRKKHHASKA